MTRYSHFAMTLFFIICTIISGITAANAKNLTLAPSKISMIRGETFTLDICIDEADDVIGCTVTLIYPHNVLALEAASISTNFFQKFYDARLGANLAVIIPYESNIENTGKILLSGSYINLDLISGGGGAYTGHQTLWTINFRIRDDAPMGSFNFELRQTMLCSSPAGWGLDHDNNGKYDEADNDEHEGVPILVKAHTKGSYQMNTPQASDDFEILLGTFPKKPTAWFSICSADSLKILYQDSDADGYGDPNASILLCNILDGYVSNNLDCNDNDPNINPDAAESCDWLDNDCDGSIDEDFFQIISLQEGWNLISFQVKKCFYEHQLPSVFVPNGVEFEEKESLLSWLLDDQTSPIRDTNDLNKVGDWQRIISFDRNGAHILDKNLPSFANTLHYFSLGYGYWVKMNKAGLLMVECPFAALNTSLALDFGWNLIGYIPYNICHGTRPKGEVYPYQSGYYKLEEKIDYSLTSAPLVDNIFHSISGKYLRIISFDPENGAMIYDSEITSEQNNLHYLGPKYG